MNVNELAIEVRDLSKTIDARFEQVIQILDNRFTEVFEAMQLGFLHVEQRFDRIDTEYAELGHNFRGLERRQGTLELLNDDQSDQLMEHEERLTMLERWKKGSAGI